MYIFSKESLKQHCIKVQNCLSTLAQRKIKLSEAREFFSKATGFNSYNHLNTFFKEHGYVSYKFDERQFLDTVSILEQKHKFRSDTDSLIFLKWLFDRQEIQYIPELPEGHFWLPDNAIKSRVDLNTALRSAKRLNAIYSRPASSFNFPYLSEHCDNYASDYTFVSHESALDVAKEIFVHLCVEDEDYWSDDPNLLSELPYESREYSDEEYKEFSKRLRAWQPNENKYIEELAWEISRYINIGETIEFLIENGALFSFDAYPLSEFDFESNTLKCEVTEKFSDSAVACIYHYVDYPHVGEKRYAQDYYTTTSFAVFDKGVLTNIACICTFNHDLIKYYCAQELDDSYLLEADGYSEFSCDLARATRMVFKPTSDDWSSITPERTMVCISRANKFNETSLNIKLLGYALEESNWLLPYREDLLTWASPTYIDDEVGARFSSEVFDPISENGRDNYNLVANMPIPNSELSETLLFSLNWSAEDSVAHEYQHTFTQPTPESEHLRRSKDSSNWSNLVREHYSTDEGYSLNGCFEYNPYTSEITSKFDS